MWTHTEVCQKNNTITGRTHGQRQKSDRTSILPDHVDALYSANAHGHNTDQHLNFQYPACPVQNDPLGLLDNEVYRSQHTGDKQQFHNEKVCPPVGKHDTRQGCDDDAQEEKQRGKYDGFFYAIPNGKCEIS